MAGGADRQLAGQRSRSAGLRNPARKAGNAAKIPFSWLAAAQNRCLKFNRAFEILETGDAEWQDGTMQPNWAVRHQGPWLARFFGKLVLDILPAALASVIGGFLFTQYHSGHSTPPQLVDVQPASPEMMAMVRDEHALIIDYLKTQMAAEQRRDQAEDAATARAAEEARAAADAKLADALFGSQTMAQQSAPAAAPAPPKVGPAHRKTPAVARRRATRAACYCGRRSACERCGCSDCRPRRSARAGLAARQSACRRDAQH